ncbi:unnamed protein product [Anisakis simplex]|uniref:Uncharacterized protein n=1 Tax=Anisakis simplex TaxID=6269 RepID=A0A0M3JRA1_ANISI|nr:unnamed protein product [Anisakis simplex]
MLFLRLIIYFILTNALISALLSASSTSYDDFEIDISLPNVVCRQCVQLWRMVSKDNSRASTCGPNARTCTGNACFMRQCKHCPVYQYMSGCLMLTEWQISDLALSRQRAELLATRVGATLLCEDSANQTTCNLFGGIINFDAAIARIDPRYGELLRSKQQHQNTNHAFHLYNSSSPTNYFYLLVFLLLQFIIFSLISMLLNL